MFRVLSQTFYIWVLFIKYRSYSTPCVNVTSWKRLKYSGIRVLAEEKPPKGQG